jgi:hypothetical protein
VRLTRLRTTLRLRDRPLFLISLDRSLEAPPLALLGNFLSLLESLLSPTSCLS